MLFVHVHYLKHAIFVLELYHLMLLIAAPNKLEKQYGFPSKNNFVQFNYNSNLKFSFAC